MKVCVVTCTCKRPELFAFWPRDPQHAKRREWLGEDATDDTNLL